MTREELKSMIRLWHRQGLFARQDLDRVGQLCLAWAVSDERNEETKLRIDLNEMIVAATNPELYRRIKMPAPENPWLQAEEFEQVLAEAQTWLEGQEEPQ